MTGPCCERPPAGLHAVLPKTGYCRISIGDTLEEAKADAIAASNNLQQPCSLLLRADYSVIGYTSRQNGDNFMAFEFRNRT